MTPALILSVIAGYFLLLLFISYLTGRKSNNKVFFIGNKKSPWFLVAFGMIGASLSGVTFISVPGWVGTNMFSYMQMVLGYMAGYLVIALILMPVYYKLNLTSIYRYLLGRFGNYSYKTGAFYFLISRVIGASFRLFLVAIVLQTFVFDSWNVPFAATVSITIVLIWIYTFRGGIKTIVWTDSLQTLFMLSALGMAIILIAQSLNLNFDELITTIKQSEYSQIFFWDWKDQRFFPKQFLSGAFIAIVMTGLDQDMMQKNLSIYKLGNAQKNIYWQMGLHLVINLVFLSLGALLYIYANTNGIQIPERSDNLFPLLSLEYLGAGVGIIFTIGLIAAAYSSADSALTALTTSFCIDFLGISENGSEEDNQPGIASRIPTIRLRYLVHMGFSILLLITIIIFERIGNRAVIDQVFTFAMYTYGPLLGLYAFGFFTSKKPIDHFVPIICIISPILTYLFGKFYPAITYHFSSLFNVENVLEGYKISYELLIINGLFTFIGLLLISKKNRHDTTKNKEEKSIQV